MSPWPARTSRNSLRPPRLGAALSPGALGGATATLPVLSLLVRNLSIGGFGLSSMTRGDAKLKAPEAFIGDGLASGDLKSTIATSFPFERIVDAHRYLEAGEQIGKILVTV